MKKILIILFSSYLWALEKPAENCMASLTKTSPEPAHTQDQTQPQASLTKSKPKRLARSGYRSEHRNVATKKDDRVLIHEPTVEESRITDGETTPVEVSEMPAVKPDRSAKWAKKHFYEKAEKNQYRALASHPGDEYFYPRRLASGDSGEDLAHYHSLVRRLGVDIGFMLPMGDFSTDFAMAPLLGLHFSWEAIPPFSFIVGMMRSTSPHNTSPGTGKLSVSAFTLGAQYSLPKERFIPFIKGAAALFFNDVSFDSTKTVTGGNDATLTTLGLGLGVGVDWIIGREVSLGAELNYYYAVKKTITLTGNVPYNLGSSLATFAIRINF